VRPPEPEPDFAALREAMVREHLEARGVRAAAVLAAMRRVPRDQFVPAEMRAAAFDNRPLPIGRGQTISQPFIVALMTDLLAPGAQDRVLEVGTGSGYQAAVLAGLCARVYSLERVATLAAEAQQRLAALGCDNVEVRAGNGYLGWPGQAPFDRIIVTAAAPRVPPALLDQLAPGGRLVIPLGEPWEVQHLRLFEKAADGRVNARDVLDVAFVPLLDGAVDDAGEA
jgi:protein-L-isoaspartate(D-aspartate) O-methyltransferase